MYTSEHISKFEHLYKKGQKVWFLDEEDLQWQNELKSGKIELIEFDCDSGRVDYFVSEYGYFSEEELFESKDELIKAESLENQIELERAINQVAILERALKSAKKEVVRLKNESLEKVK